MKKVLYRIILYANIVFAAALLLSYLSSGINPSVFWIAAFPGLMYPYLLVANILFGVACKIKKGVFDIPDNNFPGVGICKTSI